MKNKQTKRKVAFLLWLSVSVLSGACTTAEDKLANGTETGKSRYFSLEQYFSEEILKLEQQSPTISKTVEINKSSETKKLEIKNWKSELSAFMDSDINKAAWVNSYSIDSTANRIVYNRVEPGLRTKQLTLELSDTGGVTGIFIINEVSNLLYTTGEQLHFYPDSLYEIVREQDIRIVGQNKYRITGRFHPMNR